MLQRLLSRLHIQLLLLVLATLAPALGIVFYTSMEQRAQAYGKARQQVLEMARQVAGRQRDQLASSRQLLESLSRSPEVQGSLAAPACNQLLARLKQLHGPYADLFVATPDGIIRCSAEVPRGRADVAGRSYFQRALASRNFSIGVFEHDSVSGRNVLVFAQPVFDKGGRLSAVVAAALDLARLPSFLGEFPLPEGATVTVLDGQGSILARFPHPAGWVGHPVPDLGQIKAILAKGQPDTMESVWLDGTSRIAGVAPIISDAGTLLVRVGLPKAAILGDVDHVYRRNLLLIVATALSVLALGWLASNRLILRWFGNILDTAKRLGAGDLDARTSDVPKTGELGELARSLDDMAADLQLRQARIEEVERELRRTNRALRVLNTINRTLAQADEELILLDRVCRVMVELGGYRMAWVGYADQHRDRSVRPMAHAGYEDAYLDSLALTWDKGERGQGPSGTAIRTGRPSCVRRIASDPRFAPWREQALQCGYQSAIALPLRDEETFGVLTIMAEDPDAFDAAEAQLLEEAANDLAFGILALRSRAARRKAEKALQENERNLAQILGAIDNVVWSVAVESGQILYLNPVAERILGRPVKAISRSRDLWREILHPQDCRQFLEAIPELLDTGLLSRQFRIRRPDGTVRRLECRARVTRDGEGRPLRIDGVATDITEEHLLAESLDLRNRAIEASRNGMLIVRCDDAIRIESINSALLTLLAASTRQWLGQALSELGTRGFEPAGWELLMERVRSRRAGSLALTFQAAADQPEERRFFDVSLARLAPGGDGVEYMALEFRDITENRRHQKQIEHQANHDSLTGLPNRNLLADRLQQALSQSHRQASAIFVLWLDIDRFQTINDSLGRRLADHILQKAAARLLASADGCSTVARADSDAFVLIADGAAGQSSVVHMIQRLLAAIREPLSIDGHDLVLSASIGIAAAPGDGQDPDTLLRNARAARYRAKEMGAESFCFYAAEMNARAAPRLRLEVALRQAVERGELFPVFQPKLDLLTGEVAGAEALLRWRHPDMGLISPAEFIPIAEESGLILPIGRWLLETVCAQIRAWLDQGLDCRTIAVNVSPLQFFRDDVVGEVAALLAKYRLESRFLHLEITESTVMKNPERAVLMMEDLKRLGIKLAIDDFGTGYSSLSALKRFPIDYLKIDRSFVTDLTVNASDAAIAMAVISLARSLDLRVIAEGVETADQMHYLRERGCDEMQGYHFSPPVSAGEFAALLRADRRLELAAPSPSGSAGEDAEAPHAKIKYLRRT